MRTLRPIVAGVILEIEPGIFVLAKGNIRECSMKSVTEEIVVGGGGGHVIKGPGRTETTLQLEMDVQEFKTMSKNFFEDDKAIGEQKKLPE